MARLLSAEPTPELAARIRQAVAESDPSPDWRFGWLWPAVATAATLLVALAVVLGRGTPSAPSPAWPLTRAGHNRLAASGRWKPCSVRGATAPADGSLVTPRSSGQAGRRGVRSPGGSLGTRQARVPRDDRAPEPEVLVPPGETEALLRFVAQLQRRAVAPDSLLVADLSAPLTEPRAVEIAPLEIIPLDPDETSGSD